MANMQKTLKFILNLNSTQKLQWRVNNWADADSGSQQLLLQLVPAERY